MIGFVALETEPTKIASVVVARKAMAKTNNLSVVVLRDIPISLFSEGPANKVGLNGTSYERKNNRNARKEKHSVCDKEPDSSTKRSLKVIKLRRRSIDQKA
jgi:hypothetical protein